MKWRIGRIPTTVLLTAAAVVVPCSAWYVAGSRAARHEAQRIRDEPRAWAQKVAEAMAERMGSRLETIRETESQRPFYQYKPFYHDPTSTCECASVAPSPLAAGPADPLIWSHFQVDADGNLTLPTTELTAYDDACRSWLDDPTEILAQLRPQTRNISGAAATTMAGSDLSGWTQVPWTEHGASDVAYEAPLAWHTLHVAGEPTLVALRTVRTPVGDLVQGLVVSPRAVADALAGAPLPMRFVHLPLPREGEVAVATAAPEWSILVDASTEIGHAAGHATDVWRRFLMLFSGTVATAVLAGVIVVGLVWKTERLARQRAQFAASAAHELRTPLAGLRIYGEMLAEGMGDPTKVRAYAGQIAAEAERLGRLVSNVLGYTQLERGAASLHLQRGDLEQTVHDCLQRVQPALSAAGAHVHERVEQGLPPVEFNPDAVSHIVQNLVDNAEKYSRGAADRTIEVALERNGGGVRLAVRDHGPGVPAPLRRRLFQPFVRGADADTPPGLGLGLTLVHRLARAHHAQVTCEDPPGGGARFVVTFPPAR